MAKSETIQADLRERVGSRYARKLRAQGKIPAVLDPDGVSAHLDIALDKHAFLATRRHHTHLYDIQVGGKTETAIVSQLQWDSFGDEIVHIEFRRVRRDVKTTRVRSGLILGSRSDAGSAVNRRVTPVSFTAR